MFVHFMRNHKIVAGVLAFLRIYIGYEWFTSGIGKVMGGFDASGFIEGAIVQAGGEHPAVQGWWAAFLEHVALPNAGLFSFLVMWGEVLVGLALILGLFTNFAALMGIVMNFAFLFSGTISTNGVMILITIFILVSGANAGRYGLDR
ncbi:MAG TPA: DoxX family protein, partial [Bacillota bacterium]|nr:DoxX family protein [Bacillota bacterium]